MAGSSQYEEDLLAAVLRLSMDERTYECTDEKGEEARFQFLLKILKGDALDAVKHLPLKPSSYDEALTILIKRYGDTEITSAACTALLSKLPDSIRGNLNKKRGSKPWTHEELLKALEQEIKLPWDHEAEEMKAEKAVEVPNLTAIAEVSYHSSSCMANVVIGGCQRSLITKQLVEKLELPKLYEEEISIKTMSHGKALKQTFDVVCLNLKTSKGQLPVKALVQKEICEPLNIKGRSQHEKLGYLKDLKLAHPFSNNEHFSVDLLIGDDIKHMVVGTGVIKGSGPDAVESCLGYLLNWPTIPNKF